MKLSHSLLVSLAFVVVALAAVAWLYPSLPQQVPIHWNMQGVPDGYRPRPWGAAMPVLVMAGFALLLWLLPRISPRGFELSTFASVYALLMLAVQAALLVILLAGLLVSAGYAVPMWKVMSLSLGALLMVLGNFMGKLRKNFFIGIRTPWTLASDAVWERTHRVGGWIFVATGALVMLAASLGGPRWLTFALILLMAGSCVLYSLLAYRRIEHR
ncbi:DUF1648 domain-containing protein [Dyella solisilvae]|uniref:DUF1648 domain-containing protein n=1 Tax=Dyella solisilvae TaxID=1920168 RepID=A0A370KBM9_9GAMM|nr:SdpI family protein [Dyella solisilvae]RDI99989.1 DUF1648 domain-containing protein [Dyella solisilvae]